VRHDEVPALGMRAMDLMAILGDPVLIDRAGVSVGDRVRLAVRARDADVHLIGIERLP
jgi:hypothetical protein